MKKVFLSNVISAMVIFLFVYAAISKLIDYQKFRIQLGQSPMLSAFAGWVAWLVPLVEVLISVLLATVRFRLFGFYASFSLMVIFASYIVTITKFSEYIPCSCGGVLQNLTWNQHLLLNIGFVLLAMTGIFIYPKRPEKLNSTKSAI